MKAPLASMQLKQDFSKCLITVFVFPSFCQRSEKKKNVIHERLATEHKIVKNKAEEEMYLKEERDKMATEAFENWLVSHADDL